MKKVFVSVPMKGRTDEAIREEIEEIRAKYRADHPGEELLFYSNLIETKLPVERTVKHEAVWYLGRALMNMSYCDDVAFSENWANATGCIIERQVWALYMKGGDQKND